ncbi:hypothetical protein DENSPDRAFT_589374 [Dentipellis sp. KUC8613]|nr:hypothetical protein DENSPDRAFT_589374 [Dentipellis sp. KUC8613]
MGTYSRRLRRLRVPLQAINSKVLPISPIRRNRRNRVLSARGFSSGAYGTESDASKHAPVHRGRRARSPCVFAATTCRRACYRYSTDQPLSAFVGLRPAPHSPYVISRAISGPGPAAKERGSRVYKARCCVLGLQYLLSRARTVSFLSSLFSLFICATPPFSTTRLIHNAHHLRLRAPRFYRCALRRAHEGNRTQARGHRSRGRDAALARLCSGSGRRLRLCLMHFSMSQCVIHQSHIARLC